MKPSVWLQVGVIAIYGTSLDAVSHKHHAMQLIWPAKDSETRLNGDLLKGPAILDSQVSHQLVMAEGWVLLVEPNSLLGDALHQILDQQAIKHLTFTNHFQLPSSGLGLTQLLKPLFESMFLPLKALSNNESAIEDARIQRLVSDLDLCLKGECIKPASWKASEVAAQLALSESRFLHLFKDQLGIAWRPYLLWRRSLCAVQVMSTGASATQAAHLAGFSDSAHLSRTFKSHFGMTIRQAHSLLQT